MVELNTAPGTVSEGACAPDLSEREVVAYLKAHADFLLRHPDLLETIELRHQHAGNAVSLIERQVEMLRARNQRLDDRIHRLTETARDNERRSDAVQNLARSLLRAPSLGAVAAGVKRSMQEDFGIDAVFVGLSGAQFKRHDIDGLTVIDTGSRLMQAFEDFFRTRLIECGPIDERRAALLFGDVPVASVAIVPLEKEKSLGMLAFGSSDPQRFQPRQGKLFLERTAELVAAAIRARI